jgi:cell division protein FtsW
LTSLHLILGIFGLLTLFGLVMVLSASAVESYAIDGSSYSVFARQAVFCLVGLVFFWLGLRVRPRVLRYASGAALVATLVLLAAVLVPGLGTIRNGARSWFVFGPLSFQPSELAKVAFAMWGAHILITRRAILHRWRGLAPVVLVGLAMCILVVLQPDLGTTIALGIVMLALLFFAGAPLRWLASLTLGGLAGALVLGLSSGYRQSRITAFLAGDSADPLGAAYQARQALFSLADGGPFGVGLGQGRAKWSYLPNAHNDFIFAIIGEELGMIGALVVLALFGALAYAGLRIAARCTDPWLRLVVATLTVSLVAQAAINICYVVGLVPVTGIQLPLVSSGGSSLVITMFVFGVLANAARHEPEAVAAVRTHGQGRLAKRLGLRPPQPYRPSRSGGRAVRR